MTAANVIAWACFLALTTIAIILLDPPLALGVVCLAVAVLLLQHRVKRLECAHALLAYRVKQLEDGGNQ